MPRDPEVVVVDDDDDNRASRPTPPSQERDFSSATPTLPKWRPCVDGFLLGRREDCRSALPTTPRPRPKPDAVRVFLNPADILRRPFVTPPPQGDVVVDHNDKPPSSGGILLSRRDDGYAALPTSPPRQRDVVVDYRDEGRAVASARSTPPRWRPSVGHREEGRLSHHTSPRQKRDAAGPSDGRRFPLRTPAPQQTDAVVDHNDEPRAVAFETSSPPKWWPSGGGIILARREDCRLSLPTNPSPKRDAVGISLTPSDARRLAVLTQPQRQDDVSDERRGVAFTTSPPPRRSTVGRHDDCHHSLSPSEGRRHLSFLTPPGVRDRPRELFLSPPTTRSVPVFRDPFEVSPIPKRRSLFIDLTTDEEDAAHVCNSPQPKLLPSDSKAPDSRHGGRISGGGQAAGRAGGRRSSRGRGAGRSGGHSSSRDRGAGPSDGRSACVQVGPGSRARALAALLGDGDHRLTADGGPKPGQDLQDWYSERIIELNEEYEYLDGLLTRIKELPESKRITALARKGWTEFYTRLEVCCVVRREMRNAKVDPTPVPARLLAEVC